MTRLFAIMGCGFLAISTPCLAAAQCPSTHRGSLLSSFNVFDGNPDDHADLAPDSSRRVGGGYINVYKLEPKAHLVAVCSYANGDTLKMTLAPGAKTCRSAGTQKTLKAGCE